MSAFEPLAAIRQDTSLKRGLERSILGIGARHSSEDLIAWIEEQRATVKVKVSRTRFSALRQWSLEDGCYRHSSGGFFSIVGISVRTNYGLVSGWKQPIIHQPELGILGIAVANIGGTLHFLMQAKIEPGNLNAVQIAPTLQATKSNYTRKHKGRVPPLLDLFLDRKRRVIVDCLQSEQGARFLRKRNRNIIILVDDDIAEPDTFRWMTYAQIRGLMHVDNTINMDARTVLSALRFAGLHALLGHPGLDPVFDAFLGSELAEEGLHALDGLIAWFTELKTRYELEVERIPLEQVDEWCFTDELIHHRDHRFFEVLPIEVQIENREVSAWDQPIVRPCSPGICAFFVKEIGGVLHLLVQAKLECGNFDVLEMAPTIQCLSGSYKEGSVPFVPELEAALAGSSRILLDVMQAEEGGRFYREENRNIIVDVGPDFDVRVPEAFVWMTVGQLKCFVRFNNHVNVQARSLLAQI
jgi:oxidase EvaA